MTKDEIVRSLSILTGVLEKRVERIRVRSASEEEKHGQDESEYNEGFCDGIDLVIEEINDIVSDSEGEDRARRLADVGLDLLRSALKDSKNAEEE